MEFIIENFEIISLILFVIVIILMIILLGFNKYFAMYFSNKKFHIESNFRIDAADENKLFIIDIYNRNINDVRLSSFGFLYKGRNIDFYKTYLIEKDLPKDHKVVISSRDYLSTHIKMDTLKNIIYDINRGSKKISKLNAYVTDSLGITSRTNARDIKNQIKDKIKEDKREKIKEIKKQKAKIKHEEMLFKKKTRIERKIKRRELRSKIVLRARKLLSIFKRKNKNA